MFSYKDFYQDRDITTLVEKDGKAIGLCGDLGKKYYSILFLIRII